MLYCGRANVFQLKKPKVSKFFSMILFVFLISLTGYSIGNVDIGDSEKPRSIAVHPMRRLLFWTDVGQQQAIFRARMDGADRITLASKLDGVSAMAIDPQFDLVIFAHGKCIDVIGIDGQNK